MNKAEFKKQVELLPLNKVAALFFWYFFKPERVKKFEQLLEDGCSAIIAFKNCK